MFLNLHLNLQKLYVFFNVIIVKNTIVKPPLSSFGLFDNSYYLSQVEADLHIVES